jgi:ADP-ribose pyrophosphatase
MKGVNPEPTRRTIYQGLKIDLALQDVRLADGTVAAREVVVHPGAVALLVEIDEQHVCLIKNERYAVGQSLIEVPAGACEPGETPEQTAVRELREETGYVGGSFERISEWWVSPGVFNERMILFRFHGVTPGPTDHQADEMLENLVVSWDEALAMVADGRIHDAKTIVALLLGEKLRK